MYKKKLSALEDCVETRNQEIVKLQETMDKLHTENLALSSKLSQKAQEKRYLISQLSAAAQALKDEDIKIELIPGIKLEDDFSKAEAEFKASVEKVCFQPLIF